MRVEFEEFRDKLPEFMGRIQYGDDKQVIVTKHGVPIAKLTDYYAPPHKRRIGVADGKFIIPDDWDEKNNEIAELFGVK